MDRHADRTAGARAPLVLTAATLAAVALGGCAHALKEPPPLSDLGKRAGSHAASDVDGLLARAAEEFARRTSESARQAGETCLEAASSDPSRTEGLVCASRAFLWLTEHETDAKARLDAAGRAVQAAQWCVRIAPAQAACQYWLGASLGLQARERPSTGISALPVIEGAFKEAAAADPTLDDGGPDRALALLYLRAPGWPIGPGDPDKALEHARKAVELQPDHPPNQLVLGEALVATGDRTSARAAYSKALDLSGARAARGDQDADDWKKEADGRLRKLGTTGAP